jgi:predicted nucleic acid-binding Zn ribbon protein
MSDAPTAPSPSTERWAPVGSWQPVCVVCRGPRDPRKRAACSDKCRAALSRRRRAQTQATRDDELRVTLTEIGRLVQANLRRLT